MSGNKKTSSGSTIDHLDKNRWERDHYDIWDIPSFFILILDAIGIEFVNDNDHLPIVAPIHVKCSPEIAIKIGKSEYFNVELLDKDLWRISLNGFDYPFPVDSKMFRWEVENRKEAPTRQAMYWYHKITEKNMNDQERGKT